MQTCLQPVFLLLTLLLTATDVGDAAISPISPPPTMLKTYHSGLPLGVRWQPPKDVPNWHWAMVHDWNRNTAYERALQHTIQTEFAGQNVSVFDVGAGMGLLSMIASRAGAVRVFAIEHSSKLAALAQRSVSDNGFTNIQVHVGDALDLPEVPLSIRAEEPRIIVHELFAQHMLCELAHEIVPKVRSLIHPARVIPSFSRTFAVLVDSKYLSGVGMHVGDHAADTTNIMGFDMSAGQYNFDSNHWIGTSVLPLDDMIQLSTPVPLNEVNFETGSAGEVLQLSPQEGMQFDVLQNGTARAVLIYWTATMIPGVTLSTSPFLERPSRARLEGWPHVVASILRNTPPGGHDKHGIPEWDGRVRKNDTVGFHWGHHWPVEWRVDAETHTQDMTKESQGCGVTVALVSHNGHAIAKTNRHESVQYNPQVLYPKVNSIQEVEGV